MDLKTETGQILQKELNYETLILQSIANTLQNVTLDLYNYTLIKNNKSNDNNYIIILVAIITTYALNKWILKNTLINNIIELILSWSIIFIASPTIIILTLLLFIVRFCVKLKLKLDGNSAWLANPFDSVWSFETVGSTSTCTGLYIVKGRKNINQIRQLLAERVLLKVNCNLN